MKLFRMAKPLLTWQEPTLFAARTRDRRGWVLRGVLAAAIFGVMMVGFYADRNWGGRGPRFSIAGGVTLSAFIGLFLTAMLDATSLNRQVTISDDSISAFGNAGVHFSMDTWALRDVLWARLIPPEELKRPFGVLEFQTRRGHARLGVPATLPLNRIAEVLHSQGIAVGLPGWQPGPNPAESEPVTGDGTTTPAPTVGAVPTASARIERLDEGEAGQILSPFHYRVGLVMALGPLVVSLLVGLGLVGHTLYQAKILHAPASGLLVASGVGGLALIVAGLWFTNRFANLLPSLYLRRIARSVIEMRPGALFNPRDPDVVYLDVIPRENWGKAMIKEFSDTGLMKVDALSRSLLFEGDLERWRIPAASLISVEVESYRPAGHVEGQPGGERFHVTVIRANVNGAVWEAPVSKCHVEFRPKNNALREANATALRDSIRALRPAGLAQPFSGWSQVEPSA